MTTLITPVMDVSRIAYVLLTTIGKRDSNSSDDTSSNTKHISPTLLIFPAMVAFAILAAVCYVLFDLLAL